MSNCSIIQNSEYIVKAGTSTVLVDYSIPDVIKSNPNGNLLVFDNLILLVYSPTGILDITEYRFVSGILTVSPSAFDRLITVKLVNND